MIGGTCSLSEAKDPTGCAECDPASSTTSWTIKGNVCLIDGVCHQPGDVDPAATCSCDPTRSKTAWSCS